MNAPASISSRRQKVKLTVDDFLVLQQRGAFDGYAKVELIEGDIFCMNAAFTKHGLLQFGLGFELNLGLRQIGSDLRIYTAIAIRMPASLPEPDIVVAWLVEGSTIMPLSYVALAVEISDSTLKFDLGRKKKLYAREGIAEYWVADIKGCKIHQFWSPVGDAYTDSREVAFGAMIESATIAGLSVDTSRL
jgi:Uma2 family endonuclease